MQSSLRNLVPANPNGSASRAFLVTGRVASPVDPRDPQFEDYASRCLRTWSVDVQLDSGEYLQSCRIVSLQGNPREGNRRLPRLPQVTASGETLPGDTVILGFLHGAVAAPVVLGALTPIIDPGLNLDELEATQMTTRDVNEQQNRIEFVDATDKEAPLITSHTERSTGMMVETEHRGEMRIDGDRRVAQYLERRRGGRDIEMEQMVEVDETTTASVRTSNRAAADLKSMHAVKGTKGTAMVVVEDLQARVLQLTQQVNELSKLVVRSSEAESLLLQQETKDLRTTAYSDSDSKTVGVLAEDLTARTRAGWSIGPRGELVLRRLNARSGETKIEFNDDDSLTIQIPSGPTVHLEREEVLITAGSSSARISDDDGVSLLTKGGSMISAFDDSVVVTAPECTINSRNIHLSTGSVLIGQTPAGAFRLPAAERLQVNMLKIELALKSLVAWARTHTHPVAGPVAGPSASPLPPTASPSNLFNLATDTLKSLKGV